jgi:hypothetical protein
MNRTSRSSMLVRIAARSPGRSMAGRWSCAGSRPARGDDRGQSSLAEAGRAVEQDVIGRLLALAGRREQDGEFRLTCGWPVRAGSAAGGSSRRPPLRPSARPRRRSGQPPSVASLQVRQLFERSFDITETPGGPEPPGAPSCRGGRNLDSAGANDWLVQSTWTGAGRHASTWAGMGTGRPARWRRRRQYDVAATMPSHAAQERDVTGAGVDAAVIASLASWPCGSGTQINPPTPQGGVADRSAGLAVARSQICDSSSGGGAWPVA